jgi:hypothetical protein
LVKHVLIPMIPYTPFCTNRDIAIVGLSRILGTTGPGTFSVEETEAKDSRDWAIGTIGA